MLHSDNVSGVADRPGHSNKISASLLLGSLRNDGVRMPTAANVKHLRKGELWVLLRTDGYHWLFTENEKRDGLACSEECRKTVV